MKKTSILFGIILMNMAMVSCSADSILGETDLLTESISANGGTNGGTTGGGNGGGSGTGSTTINPPPPPPIEP